MSDFTLYHYHIRRIRHRILVEDCGLEITTSEEITHDEAIWKAEAKFNKDPEDYDIFYRTIADEEVEQEFYVERVEAERQVFDCKTLYPET